MLLIFFSILLRPTALYNGFFVPAGQERFKALRTPFYRGTDICLLAYAINDRDSFKGLVQWRDEFLKYADVKGEQFPFIVVGNKVNIEKREL